MKKKQSLYKRMMRELENPVFNSSTAESGGCEKRGQSGQLRTLFVTGRRHILNLLTFCTLALFCAGCGSLLSYNGEDLDKARLKTVHTNESMVFSTYQKESDGISLRLGISKASVDGALVMYAEFTNNSDEDHVFNVKNMKVTVGNETLALINSSDYLNVLQGEQTNMIASMQAMAPTLKSIASISNSTYANETRNTSLEYLANDSTTKDIADLVSGIPRHTVNASITVKSGTKNYYYLFYRDIDTYPINVQYGDLSFSFIGKSTYNKYAEQ